MSVFFHQNIFEKAKCEEMKNCQSIKISDKMCHWLPADVSLNFNVGCFELLGRYGLSKPLIGCILIFASKKSTLNVGLSKTKRCLINCSFFSIMFF